MMDLVRMELSAEERERLRHPLVGGVLLFTRNYESPEQLEALVREIHELRRPKLLIAVDHEGGRVQRFRSGFTRLPSAGAFGLLHERDPREARRLAELTGWLMAVELRAVGVDFSFAPVLDVDRGLSEVIGDRAFHHHPEVATTLARAFIQGMHRAGMAATGKHFPGHGGVRGDSHLTLPVDDRPYEEIAAEDMLPFERLCEQALAAVMPAHVIYSRVDERPAGFSPVWIREVLRGRLGFQGVVFSDDLSMAGAEYAGGYPERARAALEGYDDPVAQMRLARLHGRHRRERHELHQDPEWKRAVKAVLDFEARPLRDLPL